MISLRSVVILAAGLIVLAGCAKTVSPAADEAAIRAVNPAWFKAYNAGDANGVAALYADDAVLNIPGMPAVRGRAAIRDSLVKDIAASAAGGFSTHPGTAPEFGVSGDLGWEWNTFAVADKSGATIDAGKYVTVYGRSGGRWLITRDIWNSDASPAASKVADIHLTFAVDKKRTVTKISVSHKDNIVFANTTNETLVVHVDRPDGLRDPDRQDAATQDFKVDPVGPGATRREKPYKVNYDLTTGTQFKYTAQIGSSIPEDPIIIIER